MGEIFNSLWDCKDLIQNLLIDYIRATVVHAGGMAAPTAVLRAFRRNPLSAYALAVLGMQAGLPVGTINVVSGDARAIGDAWMRSELVRKVSSSCIQCCAPGGDLVLVWARNNVGGSQVVAQLFTPSCSGKRLPRRARVHGFHASRGKTAGAHAMTRAARERSAAGFTAWPSGASGALHPTIIAIAHPGGRMKVGIAGTGKMGSVVAARLKSLGHEVSVSNRTRARAQPLLDSGIGWAPSPRELVEAADIVITFLTDEKALDDVYLSASGLLSGRCAGKLFIEMSTVAPAKQRDLAARASAAGASYVECPVGGSVGPAKEGKLIGFAGGATLDVERARELLSQLCRRVEHVGPHGAGATMKLAVNLPLMVYWQTLGEALSLVEPLQLDPARVIDILADSSGGPNMLKVRGGMIAKALGGDAGGGVTVDITTMHKDVQKMLELAAGMHRQLPLTARTAESLRAAMDQGLAQADCAQLPVWWLKEASRA